MDKEEKTFLSAIQVFWSFKVYVLKRVFSLLTQPQRLRPSQDIGQENFKSQKSARTGVK